MICAAQEQAIRANITKGKIDKPQEQTKCIMRIRADQRNNHIVCECPKLAQKEYKISHDWIGRRIHWEICGSNGINVKPKWYKNQPEAVIKNDSRKIL